MSVQFNQRQQIVQIEQPENDGLQHLNTPNRVPLDRMTSRSDNNNPYEQVQRQLTQIDNTSREERAERIKIRRIFERYDTDGDGFLSKRELKQLVKDRPGQCMDLPSGITKVILNDADSDGDGQLDFEEFFELSQKYNWLVREWCVKYCRYVIPRRNGAVYDETVSGYSAGTFDSIDGAYESQMKFFPPPLAMVIFSVIETICFIVDVVHFQEYKDGDLSNIGKSTNGPVAKLFIYNPRQREEAWRFVTYMLVHVGVMHLLMNLIVQLFLGVALELVHCWWRVTLVYLSGVLAGSMGTSIANPRIYLAGASGGVYALITAHIATIIMNWHEMEYALVQLFVFVVFCGTDIGFSIYRHLNDPYDRVGYMAHLCGAVAGLLVGIGVLRNLNVRPYEKKIWWVAVTIYSALMVTGICFHIFYPDYFLGRVTTVASQSGFI